MCIDLYYYVYTHEITSDNTIGHSKKKKKFIVEKKYV